jgi:hypothetical protein
VRKGNWDQQPQTLDLQKEFFMTKLLHSAFVNGDSDWRDKWILSTPVCELYLIMDRDACR